MTQQAKTINIPGFDIVGVREAKGQTFVDVRVTEPTIHSCLVFQGKAEGSKPFIHMPGYFQKEGKKGYRHNVRFDGPDGIRSMLLLEQSISANLGTHLKAFKAAQEQAQ